MEQSDEQAVQRRTADTRGLVLEILRGDTSSPQAARKHGLTVAKIGDQHDSPDAKRTNEWKDHVARRHNGLWTATSSRVRVD